MPGFGVELGEVEVGAQRLVSTRNKQTTQVSTGTQAQAKGGKEWGVQSQERRHMMTRSAGCRDEWWRLAADG